jgi:hypothetical protein
MFGTRHDQAGAVVSFAAAAGLVAYGAWFLRKMRGL